MAHFSGSVLCTPVAPDEQSARIEPLLPRDTRGMPRMDDRCVLSGIVHALTKDGRWSDCPKHIYGPKKTLYNRFRRWAERGVRERIFSSLAGVEGAPAGLLIDSSCIKVHRTAGGAKGGPWLMVLASPKETGTPKLHAICDEKGGPHVLLLTPGNTHDAKVAMLAIKVAPPSEHLVANTPVRGISTTN